MEKARLRAVEVAGATVEEDGLGLKLRGEDGLVYGLHVADAAVPDLLMCLQARLLAAGGGEEVLTMTVSDVRPVMSGLGPTLVVETEQGGRFALHAPAPTRERLTRALETLAATPDPRPMQ